MTAFASTRTAAAALLVLLTLVALPSAAVTADEGPEAEVAAVRAQANTFQISWVAGQGDKVWDLMSKESQGVMATDLQDLKKTLQSVPADRLDDEVGSLGATAREILELKDGKAFFLWLLGRVRERERERVSEVKLDAVTVADGENGTTVATLVWTGGPGLATVASAMPRHAIKQNGKWLLIVKPE